MGPTLHVDCPERAERQHHPTRMNKGGDDHEQTAEKYLNQHKFRRFPARQRISASVEHPSISSYGGLTRIIRMSADNHQDGL